MILSKDERLTREKLLPEGRLNGREVLEQGRRLARDVKVGPSPWLTARGVTCELEEKRKAIAEGRFTFHAQIGYRRLDDSKRAFAEIHDRLAPAGWAPDRYGICLDWSMGYPARMRKGKACGTGMVLDGPKDFQALTSMAPVAPHFGDFVLGMPSAVENTSAALLAGATTIGNLSQYFTFRLPNWDDDVETTRATVEALGLLAGQPVSILVHSNLDDGYAAWFEDMASALGFAMLERWLVEDVIGLPLGHCFGHTYTDPTKRLAFQMALARANPTPGTMFYGNTTLYAPEPAANFGSLASYMLVDLLALSRRHSGQALTPIPTTEAQRIPTIDEVVDVHRAARRLAERMDALAPLLSTAAAEPVAEQLFDRGKRFFARMLEGLDKAGIDLHDPAEIMLSLRRLGPATLESRFGESAAAASRVTSSFVDEIDTLAREILANIPDHEREALEKARPRVVIATTDVHFYGKRLLEKVLGRLGLEVVDGGVSIDPDDLADRVRDAKADAIAISTYNGVALSFVQTLKGELSLRHCAPKIFIGGRLNEILEDGAGSLPVDVVNELRQTGANPCLKVEDLVAALAVEASARR